MRIRRLGYDSFISLTVSFIAECDSLADGEKRRQREEGQPCDCKDGWGGLNCNGALEPFLLQSHTVHTCIPIVCKTDDACKRFPLNGELSVLDEEEVHNMTCYKGGDVVFKNYQQCNVTSNCLFRHMVYGVCLSSVPLRSQDS